MHTVVDDLAQRNRPQYLAELVIVLGVELVSSWMEYLASHAGWQPATTAAYGPSLPTRALVHAGRKVGHPAHGGRGQR